jgi:serralysin
VRSSVSYSLGANLENLTLTGAAAIDGSGNDANNRIIGNSAANTLSGGVGADSLLAGAVDDHLSGGVGNDLLAGGGGSDTLTGGAGSDIFIFTATENGTSRAGEHDVVTDFQQGVDLLDISALYEGISFGGLKAGKASDAASLSAHKAEYYTDGGHTYFIGDTNGIAGADFTIELTGSFKLKSGDLIVGNTTSASVREWNKATGNLDYNYYHHDLLWV